MCMCVCFVHSVYLSITLNAADILPTTNFISPNQPPTKDNNIKAFAQTYYTVYKYNEFSISSSSALINIIYKQNNTHTN